jgi:glycosyltransferase involved in cell wall biosynthesis
MKILMILEYFPESKNAEITGGIEARYYYLAKYLSKDNQIVIITSWRKGLKREEDWGNITIYRVGLNHQYSNKGSFISRLRFALDAYKKAITIKDLDIIDGGSFLAYLPTYYAGKKINIKKVATYHEVWTGDWIKNKGFITGSFGEIWERIVLSRDWDKFISVSEFTKEEIINRGIDKDKIFVIKNGIDFDEFLRFKSKKTQNKKLTISCVSRLIKTKRIDDLIKAVSIVINKGYNVKCIIVGDGQEKDNLINLTKELDIDKSVEFKGFVKKHTDVLKIINQSDIFCNPSSVEGFGITLIEAMSLGVPIITSDIKPFKEINSNKVGLFFKLYDNNDLAKKIIELSYDKQKLNLLSKNCIIESKKYNWKIISKDYLDYLKKIIKS